MGLQGRTIEDYSCFDFYTPDFQPVVSNHWRIALKLLVIDEVHWGIVSSLLGYLTTCDGVCKETKVGFVVVICVWQCFGLYAAVDTLFNICVCHVNETWFYRPAWCWGWRRIHMYTRVWVHAVHGPLGVGCKDAGTLQDWGCKVVRNPQQF